LFSKRLRELRTDQGITQKELGAVLKVSKKTVSAYENGMIDPSTETLSGVARHFDISIDWLLGHTDIKETPEKIVEAAVQNDPDLKEFWKGLRNRDDLKEFFKQMMKLSPENIRRAIRVIKAIEDEEQPKS